MKELIEQEPLPLASPNFFKQNRKRFQHIAHPHLPVLILNEEGQIQHITKPGRTLLQYRKEQKIAPSFFAHIHTKNLYQVMRDVADMVCYGKSKASWFFRLRTGRGQWHWFRATVTNKLQEAESAIIVHLKPADGS